jgi:undecaprenyl phosphate N,N'-diacetylbacillosamine 1-phosphate transferase
MYKSFFKRIIDFSCAITGLLILSPLFIIVTIVLCFSNHGTPFFFQSRPGKDGKIFKITKFKTMNEKKDIYGNLLPDVHRLTKIGIFVRKKSLDEFPQLLNVIKGDMSLIGPRPLLPEYLALYSEEQKRRHEIRPGITGWAQVNGRNAISWQKKFEYDIEYIDNLDFELDCRIIFLTIKKVLKSEGVNLNERVAAEYFNGNN